MKKKVLLPLILLLIAPIIVLFAGCGGNTESKPKPLPPESNVTRFELIAIYNPDGTAIDIENDIGCIYAYIDFDNDSNVCKMRQLLKGNENEDINEGTYSIDNSTYNLTIREETLTGLLTGDTLELIGSDNTKSVLKKIN